MLLDAQFYVDELSWFQVLFIIHDKSLVVSNCSIALKAYDAPIYSLSCFLKRDCKQFLLDPHFVSSRNGGFVDKFHLLICLTELVATVDLHEDFSTNIIPYWYLCLFLCGSTGDLFAFSGFSRANVDRSRISSVG
jgi:hypothetical protein